MIHASIDDNKKYSEQKMKDTNAKLDKIKKLMKNHG